MYVFSKTKRKYKYIIQTLLISQRRNLNIYHNIQTNVQLKCIFSRFRAH